MIAIVTASGVAEVDVDHPLLTAALDRVGIEHTTVVWDDPLVGWESFDLAVIRSTWDYMQRPADFLAWADRVAGATTLVNPAEVVRWNLDKRYLTELADAGLAVARTQFVAPGEDPTVAIRRAVDAGDSPMDVVVKPAISAGSNDTHRHRRVSEAAAHAAQLLDAGRVVMVQPYVAAVDTIGETGLVHVGHRLSHAFRKGPILVGPAGDRVVVGGLFAQEQIDPREPTAAEQELAEAVMDWLRRRFGELLYTRVDLVPGPEGPMVLEVELVEPSLFFTVCPQAADELAREIVGRLG